MIFEKQLLNTYKSMMHTRCDDTETVFYFSVKDFPALQQEPFAFTASAGHRLQGYFYHYADPIKGRLVVFDHGFGGGHRAYMVEIEKLCRHGFTVFAYDHTGCMESGGESTNGLAQSLCDLNDCINALQAEPRCADLDISVMGHSWGAFSAMNIAALHPEISHVVAISGFVSVEEIVSTLFGGITAAYRKPVMALEREVNPKFAEFHAVKTLAAARTKALLIYSEDDQLCRRKHYDILKAGLEGKENVSLLLVANKGHNPNYTAEAVQYLGTFGKAREKLLKKKALTDAEKAAFVASFDWRRMTEQDEAVWRVILEHLER